MEEIAQEEDQLSKMEGTLHRTKTLLEQSISRYKLACQRIQDLEKEKKNKAVLEMDSDAGQEVAQIAKNKEFVLAFIGEAKTILDNVEQELLKAESENPDLESIMRQFHNIKGGAAMYCMTEVRKSAHRTEDLVSKLKDKTLEEQRTGLRQLRPNVHMLGQEIDNYIERHKAILGDFVGEKGRRIIVSSVDVNDFYEEYVLFSEDENLQNAYVEKFMKEPLVNYFKPYDDLCKELAQEQGKEFIGIEFEGEDTRAMVERYMGLFSSLVHAFRNAVDHGLEKPDDREGNKKPRGGKMVVSLKKETNDNGSNLRITIADDGGGINPEKIREKLKSLGREDEAAREDHEVIQHVFDNGLSTKEKVTEVSGRGVGMDAIAYAVKMMGGSVAVDSTVGEGTRLHISVPE